MRTLKAGNHKHNKQLTLYWFPKLDSVTYCYNVLSVFTLFLDDFAMNLCTEIRGTLPLLKSIFKLIIYVAPTSSFPHSKCKLIDTSML